ncbi:MAG: DUF4097 family beta strand repeat protein [Spirochaetaceae bacterium]|nr:DUF4097 family beta strand repeat protein [Spirochaetaceae bacterium]
MNENLDNSPGFYRAELSSENAERLVLRFPAADAAAIAHDGASIVVEFDIRGPAAALSAWQPNIRRIEGILILAEGEGAVKATDIRIRLPAAIRDLEIHSRSGDIEVGGLNLGILAETETGRVRVADATSLEAFSASGDIEIERVGTAEIRAGTGRVRCIDSSDVVVARSKSGDIDVEDAGGDLYLETASGEISIARPRGRVRASSHAGDIEIEAPVPFGGGEATSVSGRIGFILGGADLELRAETLSGRLMTPHGEVGSPAGPRRCALSVGKGGRRLHAKSISGDIDIEY